MIHRGGLVLLDGADVVGLGAEWLAQYAPPLVRFALDPSRVYSREIAATKAEELARKARVAACVDYLRRFPPRIGGDRRREHDDVARVLSRLYGGETREVFAAVGNTLTRWRLLYSVGQVEDVEVNVTALEAWVRRHDVQAAWAAHCHVRVADDDEGAVIDDPSTQDERLDRLLRRIFPIRDSMVVDAESCTQGDELRFWSFREARFCSCSRDRQTDDEFLIASAARARSARR
jgi:hypothetical protein